MPDSEIIISTYKDVPVVTAFIDNRLEYLSFARESKLRNIYLGKVDHIVKNINAAFIRYDNGNIGYLPLEKVSLACVTNREFTESDSLHCGDEIVVQVEADEIKLKKAKLSTAISLSGKYSVLTLGRSGIGASVKLDDKLRKELIDSVKPRFAELTGKYSKELCCDNLGAIIRTNVKDLEPGSIADEVLKDLESLVHRLIDILRSGRTRTVYSCLYTPMDQEQDLEGEEDIPSVLGPLTRVHVSKAKAFLRSRNLTDYKIIMDSGIHGISSKIESLTQNKVWLKSGGFLIIEQLESFNAIDVNTGKAIKGKKDAAYEVNFEAAQEIMRQIRLRNLTGMILIDFINMKKKESYDELIDHIKDLCRKDVIHTSFIDVTGLGIMELTRNKNDKTLKEVLKEINEH